MRLHENYLWHKIVSHHPMNILNYKSKQQVNIDIFYITFFLLLEASMDYDVIYRHNQNNAIQFIISTSSLSVARTVTTDVPTGAISSIEVLYSRLLNSGIYRLRLTLMVIFASEVKSGLASSYAMART